MISLGIEKGKEMSDPKILTNDTQCLIDRLFDEVIYWSGVIDFIKDQKRYNVSDIPQMKRCNLKMKSMALILSDRFEKRMSKENVY